MKFLKNLFTASRRIKFLEEFVAEHEKVLNEKDVRIASLEQDLQNLREAHTRLLLELH